METKREIGTFLSMQLLFIGALGIYTKTVFGMFLLQPLFAAFYLATGVTLLYFLTLQLRGLEYFSKVLAYVYIGYAAFSLYFVLIGSTLFNLADVFFDILVACIFAYIGLSKRYKRHYTLA